MHLQVKTDSVYGPSVGGEAYAYEVDPAGCYSHYVEAARRAPIVVVADVSSISAFEMEGRFEPQTVVVKGLCEEKKCRSCFWRTKPLNAVSCNASCGHLFDCFCRFFTVKLICWHTVKSCCGYVGKCKKPCKTEL